MTKQKPITEEMKQNAIKLKNEGNSLLKSKNFKGAIDKYTQAIQLDYKNAVYYSNRAAAYSYTKDYQNAAKDSLSFIFTMNIRNISHRKINFKN